jgi:Icc-related predicted phosphoesterase
MTSLSIVFIADTHGLHRNVVVPEADILVHAGDLSMHGDLEDVDAFSDWLSSLPHRHKIVIAGNHDFCFERTPEEARSRLTGSIYLQDQAVEVEGIRFYGSPWQPWFHDWAFNLPRGEAIARKWALIPDTTQVLVTHGPPLGQCDRTVTGEAVGCGDLMGRVEQVRPAVHCFGHIHEAFGVSQGAGTLFINASVCTFAYEPVNPPVFVELREGSPFVV